LPQSAASTIINP